METERRTASEWQQEADRQNEPRITRDEWLRQLEQQDHTTDRRCRYLFWILLALFVVWDFFGHHASVHIPTIPAPTTASYLFVCAILWLLGRCFVE